MLFDLRAARVASRARASALLILMLTVGAAASGQSPRRGNEPARGVNALRPPASTDGEDYLNSTGGPVASPALAYYFHPLQGTAAGDLVRRALDSNGELAAARLEIGRARARLRQAGLRPNPTVDFEHTTGSLTGSAGERETSVGVVVPLELGGKRGRRVELAQAELEAVEAEVADRERRLRSDVLAVYADALAALRELEVTEGLTELDLRTVAVVQTRVSEGESAPIELNLLRAEVDRLRSRRALVEGRLRATLIRLKALAGIPAAEPLRLREGILSPDLPQPPASLDAAVEIALRTRPDLRLARLNEGVARAGLSLARAQGAPDASVFGRYSQGSSVFDDTPVGVLRDKDKTLTFGVSVAVPVFNKNQGAKEEAAVAITQARTRREFAEAVVRSEVASAYARYEAAQAALLTYEQGVIRRSADNVRTMRAAYEIGAFSVTELLAEQRRLMDSQRDFTEALTERYRAAADILTAIGVPATGDPAPNKE